VTAFLNASASTALSIAVLALAVYLWRSYPRMPLRSLLRVTVLVWLAGSVLTSAAWLVAYRVGRCPFTVFVQDWVQPFSRISAALTIVGLVYSRRRAAWEITKRWSRGEV
jgi:hypothetical protein